MESEGQPRGESDTAKLNKTLDVLISELREQKQEINSLREDVRGSTLSVATEVKKLKDKELSWRREGNKFQFNFNSEIEQDCEQASWAISNQKHDYARELLRDCQEKLKKRNKLIRIADTSEGGWETVKQYLSNPVASDSDDESKISKAENKALRKRKQAMSKRDAKRKFAGSSPSAPPSFSHGGAVSTAVPFPQWGMSASMPAKALQSFRPGAYRKPSGCCFACGEFSHFRRDCPYVARTSARPDESISNPKGR